MRQPLPTLSLKISAEPFACRTRWTSARSAPEAASKEAPATPPSSPPRRPHRGVKRPPRARSPAARDGRPRGARRRRQAKRPPTPGPNQSRETALPEDYRPARYSPSGGELLPHLCDAQRESRLDLRRVLAAGLRKVRLAAAFAPHRRRHHLRELVRRHPRHEVGRDGRE